MSRGYTLRPWRREDATAVARHANNPAIAANLRDGFPYPYTLADAEGYIDSVLAAGETTQCCRAIEVDGEAVGSVGLFLGDPADVHRRTAELGYWLAEPFWGRGIMPAAVRELCDYAFAHYDLVRIYAEPYANNAGSRRVLEKSGFELEGILRRFVFKNGHVLDACMYARIAD